MPEADSRSARGALHVASAARFAEVPLARGHYESFFLKACHPGGELAVWIRYTVHKPPDAAPKGFVWFTLFDAATGVAASKVERANPIAPPGAYIRLGDCELAPGRATGAAPSPQLDASWELMFEGAEPPVWHLPRWAYNAGLPKTKLMSPHPNVRFRGSVRAGGRSIEIEGWPGTVGHNWGSEHARRTIWIHGTNFVGYERAWLDLALARVKLGPFTTPWIANGVLALDRRRYRLGGLERVRATAVEEAIEHCRFDVQGKQILIRGSVGAPTDRFVGWIYAQPNGGERQTINCSIADLRLEVLPSRGGPMSLELAGGAAYELQMQERYPPIPLQPFP